MPSKTQNAPRNIYLADDDEDDRSMFTDILNGIDATIAVTVANDGKHLMDILATSPKPLPDILFLDLNMPRKDGFECLEEIRQLDGELKNINIVMFTTTSDPATVARTFELGATFYAIKPHSFKEWKQLIADIIHIDWSGSASHNRKFQLNGL